MKTLERTLATITLTVGYVILFALLVCASNVARADIIDDTRECFPNCPVKRNEAPPAKPDQNLKEELKWLCRESGKKDC